MANSLSIQMTPPVYPVSGVGLGGRSTKGERGEFNLSVALPVADTITMFKLAPRFRVVNGYVKTTGMGAAVTATVGIAGTPALFFASASLAASSVNTTMAPGGVDYITAAVTPVIVTLAGATTAASGQLVVVLQGYIEEPA